MHKNANALECSIELGKLSKKKNDETYEKFQILGGGVSGGHFPYVITEDLKCIKSHFEHF